MVVNTIIDIGRRRPAPLSPTRPRPQVVNIGAAEMRQHKALMEVRHREKSINADLKSAANALSVANAENDRLSRRVKELEAEIEALKKDTVAKVPKCADTFEKAMEVLGRCHEFLGTLCRDGRCDDHCASCIGASDLADDVWDVLHPDNPTVKGAAQKLPEANATAQELAAPTSVATSGKKKRKKKHHSGTPEASAAASETTATAEGLPLGNT